MERFSKIMEKAGLDASCHLHCEVSDAQENEQHRIEIQPSTATKLNEESSAKNQWDERLYNANHAVDSLAEVFKTIRSRILLTMQKGSSAGTIMVTSAMPGEGKSFIAANLSLAFASGVDQYVLLVDGDLRRPSMKNLFGRSENFGLTNYLLKQTPIPELIIHSGIPKLSLLLAGNPPSNPSELLSSIRMQKLITELSSRYTDRTIIFDAPPMMLAAEARMLAHHVDGVVLVVRKGEVGRAKIEEAINAIGAERIIGLIFNGQNENYFSRSGRYGYGDNYRYENISSE